MTTSPPLVRPAPSEYAGFFAGYVERVPEADILAVLDEQARVVARVVARIPGAKEGFAYAPGKWTVRELFAHLGDGERVFGFRAFTFSRGDRVELPAFDENAYVANSGAKGRTLADLHAEFQALRTANLAMLRALDADQAARVGVANRNAISVRALAWVMAGHVRHHLVVLKEKYGLDVK